MKKLNLITYIRIIRKKLFFFQTLMSKIEVEGSKGPWHKYIQFNGELLLDIIPIRSKGT